jgi:membrane protein
MPLKMKLLKNIWKLLKTAGIEFMDDNAIKLSAALSYYTIFAIPPLLILIIAICGFFFGADAIRGEIFGQIRGLVGDNAALQVQDIIKNVKLSHNTQIATIFGIITLLLGASGVFAEIQDSINFIWRLKAKPKKGFIKFLKNRLMSFSMIAVVGFLLMVSLIVNATMDLLSEKLQIIFPSFTVYLFYVFNILLVLLTLTMLFALIFRTLPDGRVNFKDTVIGSSFTAGLFMLGKFIIGLYLGRSAISTTYGVAGSVILILAWVYYSAIILYFGAEFTKVYAYNFGKKIRPNSYAVHIEKKELETNKDVEAPKLSVVK